MCREQPFRINEIPYSVGDLIHVRFRCNWDYYGRCNENDCISIMIDDDVKYFVRYRISRCDFLTFLPIHFITSVSKAI